MTTKPSTNYKKSTPLKFKTGDVISVDCHISSINPKTGQKEVLLDFGDIVRVDYVVESEGVLEVAVFNFKIHKLVIVHGKPKIDKIFKETDLPFLLFKDQ